MKKNAQDAVWAYGPRKMAALLGKTPSCLYHWLNGKSSPRFDTAKRIVEILGKKAKVAIEDVIAPPEVDAPRVDNRTLEQRRKHRA